MDVAGDALLAGAGLAQDEHGCIMLGNAAGKVEEIDALGLAAGWLAGGTDEFSDKGVTERHVFGSEDEFGRLTLARAQQTGCALGKIDDDVTVVGVDALGHMQDPGGMTADGIARVCRLA